MKTTQEMIAVIQHFADGGKQVKMLAWFDGTRLLCKEEGL